MKRTIGHCNSDTYNHAAIVKCCHVPQCKKIDTKFSPHCTVAGLMDNEKAEGALCYQQYCSRLYHIFGQFRTGRIPHWNSPLGVKWSPDGSNFLTKTTDNRLWLFALPEGVKKCNSHAGFSSDDSLVADHVVTEADNISDFCWHPRMSKSDPGTRVFANCGYDLPVHLWDATTGQVWASYMTCRNEYRDEYRPCYSITFNPEGDRIYAGHSKYVTPFDLHRPGIYTTQNARRVFPTSIVSAMACSPDSPHVLAAGSCNGNFAICALNNLKVLQIVRGHEAAVTQVQFSPDGRYLYSVARGEEIVCWDVRQSFKVICKFLRSCNEVGLARIYFDVDHTGQYLGTGCGEDGCVYIFETQTGKRISTFQAVSDTVNGFSFHPSQPLAVTCSGYNRFRFKSLEERQKHPLSEYENCVSVWNLDTTKV